MPKKVKMYYQHQTIMINKQHFFLLLLFVFALEGFSQNYTDFQGRFIPAVNYRINKKWKIGGEYRYSLQKDFQEFRSSAGQFQVQYDINKKFSIETGYRFTTSFTEDSHRLFSSLKFDQKFNAFTLFAAIKYQFSTGSFNSRYMNYYKEPKQMVREKLGLDYNIPKSKASVFASAEMFLRLAQNDPIKFDRMRYTVGGDYKLKHGSTLGLSVFYDDKTDPRKTDRFVLVTKYSLSIDELLKKTKKEKKKKTEE